MQTLLIALNDDLNDEDDDNNGDTEFIYLCSFPKIQKNIEIIFNHNIA